MEGRRAPSNVVRLAVLLAAAMLLSASAPTRAQLFRPGSGQTPHPAVVRVIAAEPGGASLGSGTLVDVNDDQGLVITNWHVVREAPGNVIVVFPDGFQSMGRILRMDSNWDLAAILINKPNVTPVRVAREAPRIGEPLTIAGYGSGSYRAVVGACTQYLAPSLQHPYELVELAASARQGDSGGPILNSRGELAGVLFGEGDGRTTGAYCGRVHSFLTLAVEQLHQQGVGRLAAAAAANNGTSVSADSWRAKSSAPRDPWAHEQLAADNLPASNVSNHDSAHPASFHPGFHAPIAGNSGSLATALAPVAAIAPSASPGLPDQNLIRQSGDSSSLPSQRGPLVSSQAQGLVSSDAASATDAAGCTPASESSSLVGQFFAGETVLAQLKTVLACFGSVALLFHGAKMLVRTTATARPVKKQGKR